MNKGQFASPPSIAALGAKNNKRNRKKRDIWKIIRRTLAVSIAVTGTVVLFTNSHFIVRHIKVFGARTLTPDQVVAEAHVRGHENIFWMLLHERFGKRLESIDPVIERASFGIRPPNTLILRVTERQPFAALSTAGATWLMDAQRVPYRSVSESQPGLPTIKITDDATLGAIVLGKPIDSLSIQAGYDLISLLINKKNLEPTTIEVDQNANLCLNRVDNSQVRFGQPEQLPQKIAVAQAALGADDGTIARQAAYVDVSDPDRPVWMPRPAVKRVAAENQEETQ